MPTFTPSSAELDAQTQATRRRADIRVMAVVGVAHANSHFFHLILAAVFPFLKEAFSLSWTELGFLMTVFFTVSGFGQASAGFAVDKFGARPVLLFGLVLCAASALLGAISVNYFMLCLTAVVAGAGNAVFHPSDFTILNNKVAQSRLGHAYSTHAVSGNLGWAFATVLLFNTALWGGWRAAMWAGLAVGLTVLAFVWFNRDVITVEVVTKKQGDAVADSSFGFLKLPVVWYSFAFFFFATAGLAAVQSFGVPTLTELYAYDKSLASLAVTGYMIAGAAGMFLGGWAITKIERNDKQIAIALGLGAVCALLLGAQIAPAWAAFALIMLIGFVTGFGGPSRDMLVKRAAPKGASGRVYGVVYSGLDVCFALLPVLFGWMADKQHLNWIFLSVSGLLALGIFSAWRVGSRIGQ